MTIFKILATISFSLLVCVGLAFAQAETTVIVYDGGVPATDHGVALNIPGAQVAVRFTPEVYPSRLLAIRAYWTTGHHQHAPTIQYSVWTDPNGTDGGPAEKVLDYTSLSVSGRPRFEDIDVSSHNIIINSGDFYFSIRQPSSIPLGLGIDDGTNTNGKSWISEDGGVTWFKLSQSPFFFRFNLVIRAIVVTDQATSVAHERILAPTDFVLEQNYPNPFNPETTVRFRIPQHSHVLLRIFNTLGQEIRTLTDSRHEAGLYALTWDGLDNQGNPVSGGVYLYQIQAGKFRQVKKMSMLR